jgi:uncharacterized protein with HEPN domain
MGNKTLIYKKKLEDSLNESYQHLLRLNNAFKEIEKSYQFPLDTDSFSKILKNNQDLAYSDQIIYRFSKLQDTMGAKLFKAILLYQGENVNKPFLDILNQLEKMNIINVDDWFEMRDLRNEIAHNYENSDKVVLNILNFIYKIKDDLENILKSVSSLITQ